MPKHKSGKHEEESPVGETLMAQGMRFLDSAAREIQEGCRNELKVVLERAVAMIEPLVTGQSSAGGSENVVSGVDDSYHIKIERVYNELQNDLIEVRKAVAGSIAVKKQLERQVERNKEFSKTWLDRATVAETQGNQDLCEQSRQRMAQYEKAVIKVEEQLNVHREEVVALRQKLTDLEGKVQDAFVQKELLLARSRAAQSAMIANRMIEEINVANAFAQLKVLEQEVVEREAQAASAARELKFTNPPDLSKTLADAVKTLQMTIDAIERLENLVSKQKSE